MFPLVSVAVQRTVVVPMGNNCGALFVTLARPQLSATSGMPRATPSAFVAPGSAKAVTLVGQVITGGSESRIVTVKPQKLVLPLASVTLNVFAVVPFGKVCPLASPLSCVNVAAPAQLVVKVTE